MRPIERLNGRQALHRRADQFRQCPRSEQGLQLGARVHDRLVAYPKPGSDLAVGLALGKEGQDLQLARRKIGQELVILVRAVERQLHGDLVVGPA